ncbi:GEVED domain-containing protein [Terrimonas sp. NA20]|uniref:GEVED domain-containing protein n=1 Tax=Terrimonas ginsenosidimutans TaxID=2908004 RepID=A0ABS9KQK0_9BACT|nr:GEVED domain-containing protein [Terrimonas ginsenosidimutans]MCG2614550.1 GEVED domain-containing protein [Terrimonas ginsenosidimutans]
MRKLYLFLLTLLFIAGTTIVSYGQYCTVSYPAANVEPITFVKLNTIQNRTPGVPLSQPAYEDFSASTTHTTTVLTEQTYPMTVEGNTNGNFVTYIDVYIDWNKNNLFTDAGEHYLIGTITNSTGSDGKAATGDILVPAGAAGGATRMRVVKNYNASAGPCVTTTTGYGQVEDYTITVTTAPACLTPPGGGIIAGPSGPVCANIPFVLSVTGASFGTGITYQWQSSPDGSTWTDIAGANTANYTAAQTLLTHYRRIITCNGQSEPSTSISVGVKPVADCYCTSEAGNSDYEYIGNVTITGGVSNMTDATTYSNYSTTHIATVFQGQTIKVTIEAGVSPWETSDVAYVYADFNQDGDFTDPGEYVGSKSGNTSPYVITFTVPATATLGNTRLRIKFGDTFPLFTVNQNNPCQESYSFGEVEDYGLLITVPPSCIPVHNVIALPVSPTDELISWAASATNPANGYIWEVRQFGAGGSGSSGLVVAGTTAAGVTSATVTGLSGGATYFLWVRSDCGSGDLSMWEGPILFTTVCDPATVPFVQNFDATLEPDQPECVIIQDVNGATGWKSYFDGGDAAFSQPVSIRYEWDASTPADDWFFLQGLTLTGGKTYTLSFKYKASDGPDYLENLEVKYGTAPNAAGMTLGTLFREVGIASSFTSPFATATVTFTPTADGVYYLGFHAFSDADQAFIYVDDITVESCATPLELKAFSATSTTAEVSFVSSGNSFVVEYGPAGFAPGTGATAGGGTIVPGVTSSPVVITGLTPDTNYEIYVRQNCGGGAEFSMNAVTTVRTLCSPTVVPYLVNFENATAPVGYPSCTSIFDANGSSGPVPNTTGGQYIIAAGTSPDTYVSPTRTLRYIYDAANTARGADDWFFLQGLQLTGGTKYRLKFYYKASNGPVFIEQLEVKYGTSAHPSAMTQAVWQNNNINTAVATPWDSARIDITPAATGVYYFGFHAKSAEDQGFLYLDDISVRLSPVVDAGIPSIKETLPTCPANNFVMTAKVVNYNLTPLNLATYPITVTAEITGAATNTLTATVNTGTIAPGDTLQVPLPAFNFAAGLHNILFKVTNPNDSENANDSYATSIYVNPTPVAAIFTPAAPQNCAQITTQFAAAPPASVEMPAVTTGAITVAVPDNLATGVTNSLNVTGIPAGAQVTGVRVVLNVNHTWISDLTINLRAPNGRVLNLINAKGGGGVNFVNTTISSASTTPIPASGAPYTNTYRPDAIANVGPTGMLSNAAAFSDLFNVGNGTWTLGLRDRVSGDAGTLVSWSIIVTYGFPHPTVTWSPATGLFTDAAGTVPYVAGTNAYALYANPATEVTYTVTSSAAGCSSSSTVTVKPLNVLANWPAKICLSDEQVQLSATPSGGTWSGTGVSGNVFIPAATAVGSYPLTYRYTNAAGCVSTTRVVAKVEDCPERVRLLRDDAVILYPNPTRGQLNIRINSVLYNNLNMRVYTTSGLLVHNRTLTNLSFGRVVPVDLTMLPAGSYMVQFYYDGGVRTSDKTFPVIITK